MMEIAWLAGLSLLCLCALGTWRVLPVLLARFDTEAMRVEPPTPISAAASAPGGAWNDGWARLQAWCFDPAGDGRLSVLEFDFEPVEERACLIERFSRHLDGSDQLAAGGAFAGLLLRLSVKFNDCLWWRARLPSDPWDCGYLIGSVEGLRALQRFQPRRATLMVADGLDHAVCREALQTLVARSADFRHPVRVLVAAPH